MVTALIDAVIPRLLRKAGRESDMRTMRLEVGWAECKCTLENTGEMCQITACTSSILHCGVSTKDMGIILRAVQLLGTALMSRPIHANVLGVMC